MKSEIQAWNIDLEYRPGMQTREIPTQVPNNSELGSRWDNFCLPFRSSLLRRLFFRFSLRLRSGCRDGSSFPVTAPPEFGHLLNTGPYSHYTPGVPFALTLKFIHLSTHAFHFVARAFSWKSWLLQRQPHSSTTWHSIPRHQK